MTWARWTLLGTLLTVPSLGAAQDAPAYSYDYSGQSMALTSSAIDDATVGEVARRQPRAAGRTAPRGRKPATARKRDAQTEAACSISTPMLRSMGLQPAAECR